MIGNKKMAMFDTGRKRATAGRYEAMRRDLGLQ